MKHPETLTKCRLNVPATVLFLLLLIGQLPAHAQGPYTEVRNGSMGIRLDVGISTPVIVDGGASASPVDPYLSAGVLYNVSPRLRAGADYNYSRFSSVKVSGNTGGKAGDVYTGVRSPLHGFGVTAEFNVLPSGPLSLYVGTGAGCLLSRVESYTLGGKSEVKETGGSDSEPGSADKDREVSLYVPATVSLEYAILPKVSAALGFGYRFIAGGKEGLPKGLTAITAGLRFNL